MLRHNDHLSMHWSSHLCNEFNEVVLVDWFVACSQIFHSKGGWQLRCCLLGLFVADGCSFTLRAGGAAPPHPMKAMKYSFQAFVGFS